MHRDQVFEIAGLIGGAVSGHDDDVDIGIGGFKALFSFGCVPVQAAHETMGCGWNRDADLDLILRECCAGQCAGGQQAQCD